MCGDTTTRAVPAERDRAFHVSANGEQRFRLRPRETQLAWRAAASDAQWPHPPGNAPINGIVSRAHNWPVVLQESVRNRLQTMLRFLIVGQHRLTADVPGRCDDRSTERVEQ